MNYLSQALGLPEPVMPLDEWLEEVSSRANNDEDYPVKQLHLFFKEYFQAVACGQVVLDMQAAARLSSPLRSLGALERSIVHRYVEHWKKIGYIG